MPVYKAVDIARESGLDLVEVGPNGKPPVCKVIDYGKFKYEQEKNQQKSKLKNRAGEIKEVRFSITTDEHDFRTKIEKAKDFIEKGYKLKVTVVLSGRENIYSNKAIEQLDRVKQILEMDFDQKPSRTGTRFSAILIKSKNTEKETENAKT
jgi:translation initiation factor IF-3